MEEASLFDDEFNYTPVPDEERVLVVTLRVPYFGKPKDAESALRAVVDAVHHGVGRNVQVLIGGESIDSAELIEDA